MTVDGLFLTDKVNKIYRDHQILPIPFMTGLNSDEGGWLLPSVSPRPFVCNGGGVVGLHKEGIVPRRDLSGRGGSCGDAD